MTLRRTARASGFLTATAVLVTLFQGTALQFTAASERFPAPQTAAEILSNSGVRGGLIVHIGCGDGRLTAGLHADGFQVQGLARDPSQVREARRNVHPRCPRGQVSIARLGGTRLPYIDNLVNLVVAEDLDGIAESEVIRVLVPNGVAFIRRGHVWEKTVKPRGEDIDEWTHYLHDASGNAVAHDDVVGPPKHLQWLGSPRWSRHHDRMASMSALVSAGGRIFYIMDEGSRVSIQMPPKWMLVARDAFNGTILWKKPIASWHSHLWPLKSGPTQLARRLVAVGDQVYVTLGIDAPLSALDAATGELRHTFGGSEATEEVITHQGFVVALVNKGLSELKDYAPEFNLGDQRRVAREYAWNKRPREIMAFTSSGGRLWSRTTPVSPLTLTADSDSVIFHDGEQVVRLDRYTGETIWKAPRVESRRRYTMNFGPRLVLHDGVVLFAGGDEHTVHALDADSGEPLWSYATGGRVDSPPTIDQGRVFFGSADGWVYCLRGSDGALVWRFRAAPRDLRLTAFEQIESVWPVHGSVLVQDEVVYCVAGRSNFLDGGLRFLRLHAGTGEKLSETILGDTDPETGADLQARLQVLNMPVGLPDVLSSDGRSIFMRSQEFDLNGSRIGIGPHSGQPAKQGAMQRGAAAHLFAPMGFLDDTWFHRAYWIYGRSFAGGHSGYHQAGKYAPAGRILVADSRNVYGFGRNAQYFRWTTPMEHQLFSASRRLPAEALGEERRGTRRAIRRGVIQTDMIRFADSPSLNAAGKPLAVMAWVNPEQPTGVIAARGDATAGYALVLKQGRPQWIVRSSAEKRAAVTGPKSIVGEWAHLAGVLTGDGQLQLYVNGRLAASDATSELISADPAQPLEVGGAEGDPIGDYAGPNLFMGAIDELRLYHGDVTAREIALLSAPAGESPDRKAGTATLSLFCSFDDGDAKDHSGNENHGRLDGNRTTDGKARLAMRFRGRRANPPGGSFVKHHWRTDVPLLVRAMVKADDRLFIAGPPDLIDEEETFKRVMARDPEVQTQLVQQDGALAGELGGVLLAVSATHGETLAEHRLGSLPVWDGMAAASGRLYLATIDGTVICLGE